jgi:phospholipase C
MDCGSQNQTRMLFQKIIVASVVALLLLLLSGCALVSDSKNGPPGTVTPPPTPPPIPITPGPTGDITKINHIVFMAQENRSFDHYFGHLNQYRAAQGLPTDVDGTPANAANPADDGSSITAFHLQTSCIENTSAAWATSHINFNRFSLSSNTPTLDGFVVEGAAAAKNEGATDTVGRRVMGFYTQDDLPAYHFLATQFSTSDRWFAPAPTETDPNRMYLVAATSVGHAHSPTATVNASTIFDLLEQKGISWRIYYVDPTIDTELNFFTGFVSKHRDRFFPISQYMVDVANGNLASVTFIDPGFQVGSDEHPGTGNNIQKGSAFVVSLIKALMQSSSWKDSVFILTFDEHGGMFDHVASRVNGQPIMEMTQASTGQPATIGMYSTDSLSQVVPSPDGIPPRDLTTTSPADPPGDFDRTGFRLPFIVVSPFSKAHYVSHTPADNTSILTFIEDRFTLPRLTKRDAAGINFAEFFNTASPAWLTPPAVPDQPTTLPCRNTLP